MLYFEITLSVVGPFNGDCSFETSLNQCQWTQSAGDDGDWLIASTTRNGPKRDHRNTATGAALLGCIEKKVQDTLLSLIWFAASITWIIF